VYPSECEMRGYCLGFAVSGEAEPAAAPSASGPSASETESHSDSDSELEHSSLISDVSCASSSPNALNGVCGCGIVVSEIRVVLEVAGGKWCHRERMCASDKCEQKVGGIDDRHE
jgi:hypothetical protein